MESQPAFLQRLPHMPPSAGIYCRISEDREGAGLGVERQRQDCLAIVGRQGWKLFDVYTDNDISAYSGKPRPQYKRLCEDIEAGLIRAVVVWHLDRLHRQPRELESFIDLVERQGVQLASVSGDHDLSTPEGRLHARILGAVARMESEHKSRRIRRQKEERRKQGLPLGGGCRAYGYERDGLTVVSHEAAVLREARSRLLSGESLRSICFSLNRSGELTTAGKGWCGKSLTRALTNPRVAGLVMLSTGGRTAAAWPAIFTQAEYDEVVSFFQRRKTGKHWKRKYLLSGLLRCGECGAPLVAGTPRHNRGRIYWCYPYPNRGCGRVSINAAFVESLMSEAVLAALGNLRVGGLDADALRGRHERLQELESDRQQLEEIAAAYAHRAITLPEWLAAREPVEARIQAALSELQTDAEIQRLHALAGEEQPRHVWPSLIVDQQRSIISTVIDHIEIRRVGKGRYREPGRVNVVWRA